MGKQRQRKRRIAWGSKGDKEAGFDCSSSVNTSIPSYNSVLDRNCPMSKTDRFVKHYKRQQRMAEAERLKRKRNLQRMASTAPAKHPMDESSPTMRSATSTRGGGALETALLNPVEKLLNVSTASGGITFGSRTPAADLGSCELDVLKAILLREGYIERLKQMTLNAKDRQGIRAELVDVLDLVRESTVDVVELILKWRKAIKRSAPFVWNGVNYLLKIPTDMDFLRHVSALKSWLRFELTRNPLVVPQNLDARAQSGYGDEEEICVGGGPIEAPPSSSSALEKSKPTAGSIVDVMAKPYNNPVVSDRTILPGFVQSKPPVPPKKMLPTPTPTHVGDVDILRIREVEKVILQEETLHGRFVRDAFDRLVPETHYHHVHLLETKTFDDSFGGQPDDSFALNSSMNVSGERSVGTPGSPPPPGSSFSPTTAGSSGVVGKRAAVRHGGMLSPLSKASTPGVRKGPRRRAAGSRVEVEIAREEKTTKSLMKELTRLKQELKEEEGMLLAIQDTPEDSTQQQSWSQTEIASKAREVAERRSELHARSEELARRQVELQRKKRMRDEYARQQALAAERKQQKLLELKRREAQGAPPIPLSSKECVAEMSLEELAAIQIQRIARGMAARLAMYKRRRRFNAAAVVIQSVGRGSKARRRVGRMRLESSSAVTLQRHARGMRARIAVNAEKRRRLEIASAVKIQKTLRGKGGRKRFLCRKALLQHGTDAMKEACRLHPEDLDQLRELSDPPPTILGVLQCVLILCREGLDPPPAARDLTWEVAKRRMRSHGTFLKRLKAMAQAALQWRLQLPKARVKAVEAFFLDPLFTEDSFRGFGGATSTARGLLAWLRHIVEAYKVSHCFLETPEEQMDATYALAEEIEGIQSDNDDDEDYDVGRTNILKEVKHEIEVTRPRPVLVAISRDIASYPKRRIVEELMNYLPGFFSRVDTAAELDGEESQPGAAEEDSDAFSAFSFGDASVSRVMTRAAEEAKYKDPLDLGTLQGVLDLDRSLIVDVDIGLTSSSRNEFLSRMSAVRAALTPNPVCVLVTGFVGNRCGAAGEEKLGVGPTDLRVMQDGIIKRSLEIVSESVFSLNVPEKQKGLTRLSRSTKPPPASTVMVLEALIVLLSPNQRFKGPDDSVGFVTWNAAKRILSDPEALVKQITLTDINSVPEENEIALQGYVRHPNWPSPASLSKNKALQCLAMWVTGVANYTRGIAEFGGPAVNTGKKEGIFASVIAVKDPKGGATEFGDYGGDGIGENGWRDSFHTLLRPVLRDVKVYGEAKRIDERYMALTVYKDVQRLFFGAYEPSTSIQRFTYVDEADVGALLAPNSLEEKDHRPMPKTANEVYSRLVAMLHLRRPPARHHRGAEQEELVLRRPLLRLLRETRLVDGQLVTLTASEKAAGELVVQLYCSRSSDFQTMVVDERKAWELGKALVDDEREAFRSGDAPKMLPFVVDRLQYRVRAGKRQLSLRTTGGPGRRLLEQARRVCGVLVIITVFELQDAGMRIELYVPRSAASSTYSLSRYERRNMLGSLQTSRKVWAPELFRRLQLRMQRNNKGHIEVSVVLNRQLHLEAKKLDEHFCTIKSILADDSFRGITFHVFEHKTCTAYELTVSDKRLRTLLKPLGFKWPVREGHRVAMAQQRAAGLSAALKGMEWRRDSPRLCGVKGDIVKKEVGLQPSALIDGLVAESLANQDQLMAEWRSQAAGLEDDEDSAAGGENADLDEVQRERLQDLSEARIGRLSGKHLFQRGCRLPLHGLDKRGNVIPLHEPPRFVRVTAKLLTDTSIGETELVFLTYNPTTSKRLSCRIEVLTDAYREALGIAAVELSDPDRMMEAADWMVRQRLVIVRRTVRNTDSVFEELWLKRDRLYSEDKVTPITKSDEAQTKVLKPGAKRGKKLFSQGHKFGDILAMITVFDHSAEESDEDMRPVLRFLAYEPTTSTKASITLHRNRLFALSSAKDETVFDDLPALGRLLLHRFRLRTVEVLRDGALFSQNELWVPTMEELHRSENEKKRSLEKQERIAAVRARKEKQRLLKATGGDFAVEEEEEEEEQKLAVQEKMMATPVFKEGMIVDGVFCIVSVFIHAHADDFAHEASLRFLVQSVEHAASSDVIIGPDVWRRALLSRRGWEAIPDEFDQPEERRIAFRTLCQPLCLTVIPPPEMTEDQKAAVEEGLLPRPRADVEAKYSVIKPEVEDPEDTKEVPAESVKSVKVAGVVTRAEGQFVVVTVFENRICTKDAPPDDSCPLDAVTFEMYVPTLSQRASLVMEYDDLVDYLDNRKDLLTPAKRPVTLRFVALSALQAKNIRIPEHMVVFVKAIAGPYVVTLIDAEIEKLGITDTVPVQQRSAKGKARPERKKSSSLEHKDMQKSAKAYLRERAKAAAEIVVKRESAQSFLQLMAGRAKKHAAAQEEAEQALKEKALALRNHFAAQDSAVNFLKERSRLGRYLTEVAGVLEEDATRCKAVFRATRAVACEGGALARRYLLFSLREPPLREKTASWVPRTLCACDVATGEKDVVLVDGQHCDLSPERLMERVEVFENAAGGFHLTLKAPV